jgi:cytochrome c-type biogenesis protein CcmH
MPRWRHIMLALACWGALAAAQPALAVQPDEVLSDANLEARARVLSLTKGDSDEQVLDFLVSRYGEFVLLKPTFEWHTAILWLTPLIVMFAGAIAMLAAIRRRRVATPSPLPLNENEERQLREVLDKSS